VATPTVHDDPIARDALFLPVAVADRDGRFQIDDARIRHDPLQLRQCIAPRVVESHGPLDRAIPALGQPDVVARIPNIGFVQPWIARMRQDLVDAAPGHHVAAQEQGQQPCLACKRR